MLFSNETLFENNFVWIIFNSCWVKEIIINITENKRMYFMFFCNIPQSVICLISSGCINVMNDEPKRQQIIPGKYFLYSHNILQIRYHVFPFSLISNCHPHYSLSKILTNKLIYILYIVSYSYSIFCIQFIHIIFTHNIHIYI